jgi:hypothetical protein
MSFFLPIIATIFVEFIVYIIFIRDDIKNLALYAILINLFTVPLANILSGNYGTTSFFIVEIVVFLVETVLILLLFKIKWWKALIVSFIANFVSMFFGILLWMGMI